MGLCKNPLSFLNDSMENFRNQLTKKKPNKIGKFWIKWIPKKYGAFDSDVCGTDYNHNYSIIIWVADSKFYLVCHVNDNRYQVSEFMVEKSDRFRIKWIPNSIKNTKVRIRCIPNSIKNTRVRIKWIPN